MEAAIWRNCRRVPDRKNLGFSETCDTLPMYGPKSNSTHHYENMKLRVSLPGWNMVLFFA